MKTTIVADYINSTEEDSRIRRKLGKAIKRFPPSEKRGSGARGE